MSSKEDIPMEEAKSVQARPLRLRARLLRIKAIAFFSVNSNSHENYPYGNISYDKARIMEVHLVRSLFLK